MCIDKSVEIILINLTCINILVDIIFINLMRINNLVEISFINFRGHPDGIMVKALDCRIVESKFELPSRYYIHF